MNKKIMMIPFVLTLFNCSGIPVWNPGNQKGNLLLDGVDPKTGGHCESSALYNALHYLGYPFEEQHIVGGGAAIGFMYQRGDFPFLGARNDRMREIFFESAGIDYQVHSDETPEQSWVGVYKALERGLPVVLRVDMRYLPYLYGGKYGPSYMHFGWHMITLFGVDFSKELAYVTDTAQKGLQTIRIQDLDRARSSTTKIFPPRREYCVIEKMPTDYKPDWGLITKNSLTNIILNYEWKPAEGVEYAGLGGLEGLKDFEGEIRDMDRSIKNSYMLPVIFDYLHGCIETNGTGGAAFRIFIRDFIRDMAKKTEYAVLNEVLPSLENSIDAWKVLAQAFRQAGIEIKKVKDSTSHQDVYDSLAEKAKQLYMREAEVYIKLKTALSAL
ncbi:MAG: DUF4872 domain-containing protein [Deltaproteobacteria bacterium]|nr:DUF4872 domain-containing protein [Deltaproteobacteria bacterium]